MKKQMILATVFIISSTIALTKDRILRAEKPCFLLLDSKLTKEQLKHNRWNDLTIATSAAALVPIALLDALEKTAEINREFIEKQMAALDSDFGNLNI